MPGRQPTTIRGVRLALAASDVGRMMEAHVGFPYLTPYQRSTLADVHELLTELCIEAEGWKRIDPATGQADERHRKPCELCGDVRVTPPARRCRSCELRP